MKRLFVYGTLKRGHKRNSWLGDSKFVSKGEAEACLLQSYGDYPGLVITGDTNHTVKGELWDVPNKVYQSIRHMEVNAGFTPAEVVVWTDTFDGANDNLQEATTFIVDDIFKRRLYEWVIDGTKEKLSITELEEDS